MGSGWGIKGGVRMGYSGWGQDIVGGVGMGSGWGIVGGVGMGYSGWGRDGV